MILLTRSALRPLGIFCLIVLASCTGINNITTPRTMANVESQTLPKTIDKKPKPSTMERYGNNIIYVDFFDLPKLNTSAEIELPIDLKAYFDKCPRGLPIHSPRRLENEFESEFANIHYPLKKFSTLDYQDAIFVTTKMIASRIKYGYPEVRFEKAFGRQPFIDESFYIGGGDCDKYQNLTILAIKFAKKINPNLKNVYVGPCDLGGNLLRHTKHAWNSIIIPMKDRLILSHIDPTFYDVHKTRASLQADSLHICRSHNGQLIIASFYRGLGGKANLAHSYDLYKKAYDRTPTSQRQLKEHILDNLAYTAYIILYDCDESQKPTKRLAEQYLWILNQYDANHFTKYHDYALYYAYLLFEKAGDRARANVYKILLRSKYPDSTLNNRIP